MKKLPIGISTLEEILNNDYLYVDKTSLVAEMANGKYYFLSRPRRFGKSLLVDTFKQAFLGNQKLFDGLHLENNWDWSKKYPVIHFDFGVSSTYGGKEKVLETTWIVLNHHAKEYGITFESDDIGLAFQELIHKLYEKTNQQVVVLIDEYDKPMLDVITDESLVFTVREILKSLYSAIKSNDAYLKFVFLTGVTKFSKVGLFSGLNNLYDITLTPQYANICGYTQTDLESVFADYLKQGNVDKDKLKLWYNGYNFGGSPEQKVYNPFDVLLFCGNNFEYRNYWFETGNPEFLIKLIQKNKYYFPNMENYVASEMMLATFDIPNLELTALLFQAGYLTIKEKTTVGAQFAYVLGYPNLEIQISLNDALATLGSKSENKIVGMQKLIRCLEVADFNTLGQIFQSHFASIPHDWYRNNDIQHYEGFYASIVYSLFCALGYDVTAEDKTNVGQLDLTIKSADKILILEFKLKKYGDAATALQQIKDKRYAEKYVSDKKPIYLVGMSFDNETRNMCELVCETY